MGLPHLPCAGATIILVRPEGQCFTNVVYFDFQATNNEAEYEALVGGLKLAKEIGARRLHIFMDSLLVVNQVKGEYEAREEQMIKYQELVVAMCKKLHQVFIEQIPMEQNSQADALSKLATSEGVADMSNIVLTKLPCSAISGRAVATIDAEGENWMTPIVTYLKARQLKLRAARYTLIYSSLYK